MCFPAIVSSVLLLTLFIGLANAIQRPRDGYNTFTDGSTTQPPFNSFLNPKWNEPYFDNNVPNNVTALVGKSAYLSCRVRNLGNKTVSWIRHRDIHILTVGTYTYTTDQRFQTAYHREINEWTMQIKWAQKRDAGTYECQISTIPIKSFSVRLNVVEPAATILGGPDLYVDKGSTINLTCTIRFGPEPPGYIFWYHENKEINYDAPRGRVAVRTHSNEWTTSYLLINDADITDSGIYVCAPTSGGRTSIKVHVFLHGERPEAMQTGTSTYIANNIMQTIMISIIISTYNIFQNFYSSILFSKRIPDEIT
ncbi:junctional adhesion molecule A-like [Sitodiplosis mosellana]|uniref:junctional adhesion molecule A-like n=1 Tax=Sitodiplosis mosellana TaxID=263140 RepID=UPI0024445FC3|nr:junctional adhesion molecule A-like [Sitodiplosis mosellana]